MRPKPIPVWIVNRAPCEYIFFLNSTGRDRGPYRNCITPFPYMLCRTQFGPFWREGICILKLRCWALHLAGLRLRKHHGSKWPSGWFNAPGRPFWSKTIQARFGLGYDILEKSDYSDHSDLEGVLVQNIKRRQNHVKSPTWWCEVLQNTGEEGVAIREIRGCLLKGFHIILPWTGNPQPMGPMGRPTGELWSIWDASSDLDRSSTSLETHGRWSPFCQKLDIRARHIDCRNGTLGFEAQLELWVEVIWNGLKNISQTGLSGNWGPVDLLLNHHVPYA